MNNLHILDIAVIAAYLIICLAVGLYKSGKIKSIQEYTLGNGYISSTVLTFTIFATYIGAGPTIGVVEAVHSMGMIFAITLLFKPLFWILTATIFGKTAISFKEKGCISITDIMEMLYGKPGKWVANFMHIFLSVGMIAVQITAIGYLFNYFLMIPKEVGALIGFGVLVVYSTFGGIRAVALTDTFQGLVLLVAVPVACSIAYHEIGGFNEMIALLPQTHTSLDMENVSALLLISLIFNALVPVSSCTYMQRFLMANNKAQLMRSLWIIVFLSLPFALVVGLIGFVMKAKAPEIDPNTALFYLISNYLPIGVTGFLIAGVLAAIMSTADSWLNTCSVICAHNIAKSIFPKITEKQELLIARISVLFISAISLFIAFGGMGLMELSWLIDAFIDPTLLIPMILGFLGFRTNSTSFVASVVLGIGGAMIGRYIMGEFNTVSALLGVIGSFMGMFSAHWLQILSGNNSLRNANHSSLSNARKAAIRCMPISALKEFFAKPLKHKQYCYFFGGLGMIYFLSSSFFMTFTDMKILHTIVYMKAIAALLCFGLFMCDFYLSNRRQMRYLKLYWNAVLCYCLPFLSSYIVFVYAGDMPWIINWMLSVILLYILNGAVGAMILSTLGLCLAYLLFKATGYTLAVDSSISTQYMGYIYCTMTVGIMVLLKQKDLIHSKEMQAKLLYGAAIAHEVSGPLQGSAMMADTLIQTFKDKNTPEEITKDEFLQLKTLLQPFKDSSIAALNTVDMLLASVRSDIAKADDMGFYSMQECIASSIKNYKMSSAVERINIHKDGDFIFKGSKHFMVHVISNLIRNALKYAGSNCKIDIYCRDNTLYFEDDGVGISEEKLPLIFIPFDHNGNTKGNGIGLPFCRQVLETFGAHIACESKRGYGTKFFMHFPKLESL